MKRLKDLTREKIKAFENQLVLGKKRENWKNVKLQPVDE